MSTSDYMVRATAADESILAFAITSREMVEYAKNAHGTAPVVTAALGRMLSAAAMMGSMMKNDSDMMTLQIQGSGPMKGITVTADSKGHVKGFANVPDVMLPPNSKGKLDVGGAIDVGILRVIKDLGLKEPYVGTVPLQTGEIAEDITYYYAVSEQTPSSVGLGVLMNKDNTVREAGGFIIQLMPFTPDEVITKLEENIKELPSVTDMLSSGLTPETMLEKILDGMEVHFTDKKDVYFACDCSRERVWKSICLLSDEDISDIIDAGETIEVKCQFCNSAYYFEPKDIIEIKRERDGKR